MAAGCPDQPLIAGGELFGDGQRRSEYLHDAERFWLDLDSGATDPLPLKEELTRRGRQEGGLYLLDRPEGVRKLEPVRELLLRLPSGEYLPVGEILHYYGFRDGELHFWSADGRHMIYRLASRSLRPGSYGEYLALSEANMAGPGTTFSVSYQEGGWRLRWGRKEDGAWRYRTLALTVEGVAGK